MKNYGMEMPNKKGKILCVKCKTYYEERAGKQKCPWCDTIKPAPAPRKQPTLNEGERGSNANNPIPLWDRMDILRALERGFGEDYFINGEKIVLTNEGKEVKLIQIKTEEGEYKNIYFGV